MSWIHAGIAIVVTLVGLFELPHWIAAVFLGWAVFFGLAYWRQRTLWLDHLNRQLNRQEALEEAQVLLTHQVDDSEEQTLDERMLLTMLQALPEAIVVLDRQLNIVWANSSSASMLGIQPSSRGQSIKRWLHDPDFASFLQRYIDSPDQSYTEVLDSPIYDEGYCQFHLAPMKSRHALLFAYDATEQVATQKIRMDFVANASHELRTPLTVINGYIESLIDTLDALPQPEVPKSLLKQPFDDMYSQSIRLMNLANDLLDLSKISQFAQKVDPTGVNMESIINQVVTEAQALSADHEIRISDVRKQRLLANESLAQSIVMNLLFNAIYHTPRGTLVEIAWSLSDDGEAVFSVTDNGDGIPPQLLNRITERFYRVDKSHSRSSTTLSTKSNHIRQKSGTGLGLAIVKNAVQTSGGKLLIESTLGEGSIFRCVWPADKLLIKS